MGKIELNKVYCIVGEVLNIENVPPDASQESIAEWDSMAYLSIVSRLEDDFDLDINQDNINNFGSIYNIVKEIEKCKQQ